MSSFMVPSSSEQRGTLLFASALLESTVYRYVAFVPRALPPRYVLFENMHCPTFVYLHPYLTPEGGPHGRTREK